MPVTTSSPGRERLCSVCDFLGVKAPVTAGFWLPTYHQLAGWISALLGVHIPPGHSAVFQHPGQGLACSRHLENVCRDKAEEGLLCFRRMEGRAGGGKRRREEGKEEGKEGTKGRWRENVDMPTASQKITRCPSDLHSYTQSIRYSHSHTQVIGPQTHSQIM